MGTAHAGHDQCAHCYFTYVKPAVQEERRAVKGRRALKRQQRHTPAGSGVLGNQVQQEGGTLGYLNLEPKGPTPSPRPKANRIIREAIYDMELDQLIADKTPEQQLEAVTAELIKTDLKNLDVPVVVDRYVLPKPKEEPPVQNGMRHTHKGSQDGDDPLTAEQVQEIADAYTAGMVVMEICDAYNVVTTTLYNILREKGIPLRGAIRRPPPPRRPIPLRRLPMPQSTTPVSDAKVEPAPSNGVVSALPMWTVTYTVTRTVTETVTVAAKDFNAAAHAASGEAAVGDDGVVDVLSVSRKLP